MGKIPQRSSNLSHSTKLEELRDSAFFEERRGDICDRSEGGRTGSLMAAPGAGSRMAAPEN